MKLSPNVMTQQVGDELVLLDLEGETYFGLNDVGARVWELIGENVDREDIVNQLLREFDVDRERLCQDVFGLLDELTKKKLLISG